MSAPEHPYAPYPSPFRVGCARCHYPEAAHPAPPAPGTVRRDLAAEALVVSRAVTGSALDPSAIEDYAARRAHPGPVKLDGRSLRRETLEELSDARNYIVWEVCYVLEPRARAGDSVAAARIPSRLGALRKVIEIWDDLHLP